MKIWSQLKVPSKQTYDVVRITYTNVQCRNQHTMTKFTCYIVSQHTILYVNVLYCTWHTILYTICTYDIVHYWHATSQVFIYILYSVQYVFIACYTSYVIHTILHVDIQYSKNILYHTSKLYVHESYIVYMISYIQYRIRHPTQDILYSTSRHTIS